MLHPQQSSQQSQVPGWVKAWSAHSRSPLGNLWKQCQLYRVGCGMHLVYCCYLWLRLKDYNVRYSTIVPKHIYNITTTVVIIACTLDGCTLSKRSTHMVDAVSGNHNGDVDNTPLPLDTTLASAVGIEIGCGWKIIPIVTEIRLWAWVINRLQRINMAMIKLVVGHAIDYCGHNNGMCYKSLKGRTS